MKRAILTLLVAMALADSPAWAQTGDKSPRTKEGHLGLAVESVPPVVASQLPGVLAKGQGVLVEQVVKDSPAGKAALQTNDVLLTLK